jgi:hypothetical protein
MTNDPIARLAAANPLPDGAPFDAADRVLARVLAQPRRRPRRRVLAVAVAAAAVALPAAAYSVTGLFSNGGTPVPTTAVVGQDDGMLTQAMGELQFPAQVADLGTHGGYRFYVTRNENGRFCFAISSPEPVSPQHVRAIGCVPEGGFPSTERPLLSFAGAGPNRLPADGIVPQLLGFATDDVATIEALDANGATVASTPVVGNVYADTDVPRTPVAAIVALDAAGNVLYRIG